MAKEETRKVKRSCATTTLSGHSLVGLLGLDVNLLLDLLDVEMRNIGIVAIDDLDQLLESGAASLDVHEVHEHELAKDPALDNQISAMCAWREDGGW